MKNTCIAFLCKENLNNSTTYTEFTKKNIKFWNEMCPEFPIYVMTNNPDEFSKLNCNTIPDYTYFTLYNKLDLIDYLEKDFDTIIYLDCDNLFNAFKIDLNKIKPGIHMSGRWKSNWGDLKKLEYFKVWRENIELEDSIHFPYESVIILHKHPGWKNIYDRVKYFKQIAANSEKEAQQDENPRHGPERCESIAIYEAYKRFNMPIHLDSNYATQFYNAMFYCNNYQ